MSGETARLIQLLQDQLQQQREQHQEQMDKLTEALLQQCMQPKVTTVTSAIPAFSAFDSTTELWTDYWSRFQIFIEANSVPEDKGRKVFLTNQSAAVYKLLENLASQQTPAKKINDLTMQNIISFMDDQFDPKRFIVRESFKFWSQMEHKPGESIQELAAGIRQDAATCSFSSIKNPHDEAMRTRFICSVNNEAVLKAMFKVKDDDLTFARAIEIAIETEDAAKVAKETVYGTKTKTVDKIHLEKQPSTGKTHKPSPRSKHTSSFTPTQPTQHTQSSKNACASCGKTNHTRDKCYFKNAVCNFCKRTGHIEKACFKKNKDKLLVKAIFRSKLSTVKNIGVFPQLQQGKTFHFEVDTGAGDNFISEENWKQLGEPVLQSPDGSYESASRHSLTGKFTMNALPVNTSGKHHYTTSKPIQFVVSKVPDLNLTRLQSHTATEYLSRLTA